MNFSVVRYTPEKAQLWNDFNRTARNGTFLFDRNYMDYHADRFEDYSLLFYEGNRLRGLFPANVVERSLYSHQGLTFGGLIVGPDEGLRRVREMIRALLGYARAQELAMISYRRVPFFYHRGVTGEDEYALWEHHAVLVQRQVGFVVDTKAPGKFHTQRRRGIGRAERLGWTLVREPSVDDFWQQTLVPHLAAKFGTTPVHSLDEISLLARRFPQQVRIYVARNANAIGAGCVLFVEEPWVAHIQYFASSEEGRAQGAPDFLVGELLAHYARRVRYFSFGTSHVPASGEINEGLALWKEGFGASAVAYDRYELRVSSA